MSVQRYAEALRLRLYFTRRLNRKKIDIHNWRASLKQNELMLVTMAFFELRVWHEKTHLNITSSLCSTELVALTDDLLQLTSKLDVHVFQHTYLLQSSLSPSGEL